MSTRSAVLPSLPAAWRARRATRRDPKAAAAVEVTLRALVGSRLIVWGAGLLAVALFGRKLGVISAMDPGHATEPFSSAAANLMFAPAARWDSMWYLGIAHSGYAYKTWSAFFPLYPLLIRLGTTVLGSSILAGTLISIMAMAAGLCLLYRLTRMDAGEVEARSTVMLVAFFPTALFLSAVYTEALFLVLSVGAIYAARLERWAWAGVLGGLAAATRSGGVLILLALVPLYLYGPRTAAELVACHRWWRPRRSPARAAAWLALVPAGLLAYMGYLALAHHAAFAPFQAEAAWGRQFAGPFGGLVKALLAAPNDLRLGVTGHAVVAGASSPISRPTQNLVDLVYAGFAAAGLGLSWRRVPAPYFAYSLALVVQALSYPTSVEPLASLPRYVLVIFPLFMGWGGWLAERPSLNRRAIVGSAMLLGVFSGLWATWSWIA